MISNQLRINPRRHLEFPSEGGSFKLVAPLVVDEHQETSITLFVYGGGNQKDSHQTIQITASDPLILRDGGTWRRELNRRIATGGNDSLRMKTKPDYNPPSGMEGECVVQGSITSRNIDETGVILDSIGLDVLVQRKIINVFKNLWKSSGEIAKFVATSVAAALIAGFISTIVGRDISEVVLTSLGMAVVVALLVSFFYSWSTRERFINKRLAENRHYLQLIREVIE